MFATLIALCVFWRPTRRLLGLVLLGAAMLAASAALAGWAFWTFVIWALHRSQ